MPARTELSKPLAMQNAPRSPIGFNKSERTLWDAIVATRPAPTWTASDLLLLSFYIEAHTDIDRLNHELVREGDVVGGKINPRIKVRAAREQFLLSLAMKLKLCPSNRWDPKAVHRMGEHAKKAGRALAAIEADDLLGGVPTKRGRLQ